MRIGTDLHHIACMLFGCVWKQGKTYRTVVPGTVLPFWECDRCGDATEILPRSVLRRMEKLGRHEVGYVTLT
jgi:hypothetical protein